MFVHWPHFALLLFLLFITRYCVTANTVLQTFSDEACSKAMNTSIDFELNICIMTPGALGVESTGQNPCGENSVAASGYFDDSCTNEAISSFWTIGSCLSGGFQGINSIRAYCLQIDGQPPASSESQVVPSTSSTRTDITPISSSETIDSSSATEGPSSTTTEELPTTSSTLTTAVATSTTSVFPTQRSSQSSSAASDTQTSTTISSPSSPSLPSPSVVTSTSSTNPNANRQSSLSTALIAVIAVLVVLAVALLIGIFLYWRHLKNKRDHNIHEAFNLPRNPPYQRTISSDGDPTELRMAGIRGWNMAAANDVELRGSNTYAQRES